jgi:hypothetical protein
MDWFIMNISLIFDRLNFTIEFDIHDGVIYKVFLVVRISSIEYSKKISNEENLENGLESMKDLDILLNDKIKDST